MNHYEQDFYAWLMHNAQLLRQGRFAEVDVNNVAEELESMGRSERHQLVNRLTVLLMHLLKWAYQPQRRSKSWLYTLKEQRKSLIRLLKDSLSLKSELDARLTEAYEIAILKAAKETRLDDTIFPSTCPYSLEEVLNDNFYPNA
jgi:hypothetical protein